jgi:deazaflavin-dependent oxidoreductase (nitroreductase family)
MSDYIPPTIDWVRKHVERYEASGGKEYTTLMDSGLPCIIVTHRGQRTGGIRKIPLMRVKVDDAYVLIGSMGGQPKNPAWVYNLRADGAVEIRDAEATGAYSVREIMDEDERRALWDAAVEAYPPYTEYQAKTTRKIPVFLAEPAA